MGPVRAQYCKLQVLKPVVGCFLFFVCPLLQATPSILSIYYGWAIFQPVGVVFYHSQPLFPRVLPEWQEAEGLKRSAAYSLRVEFHKGITPGWLGDVHFARWPISDRVLDCQLAGCGLLSEGTCGVKTSYWSWLSGMGESRSHEQCDTVTSLVISVWSWALAAQAWTVPQGLAEALETQSSDRWSLRWGYIAIETPPRVALVQSGGFGYQNKQTNNTSFTWIRRTN